MSIKPQQQSVKTLFEQNSTFEVPKYQRGYAWEDEAIDDFIDDVSNCLDARVAGRKKNHFFGGVVTTRKDIEGSSRSNHEVIDGQQRLATFVLFVAAMIKNIGVVIDGLNNKSGLSAKEKKARKYLTETIDKLRELYLRYSDTIDLEYITAPKLTLSQADNNFFQAVVDGDDMLPERPSHMRIENAWKKLNRFIEGGVLKGYEAAEQAQRLQHIVNGVLAIDCTAIFMCSDSRREAYQIFQVLNDRGVHLTDGDLLRSSTMELLDDTKLRVIQDELAEYWDRTLAYLPNEIDDYLRWYFSSYEGKRPKPSNLSDQFLDQRFQHKKAIVISKVDAKRVLAEVKQLDSDFSTLQTIRDGEWPYPGPSTVSEWDRKRLTLLVGALKHTNAMPLLLSLCQLSEKRFADAVALLERFVFRYKTVGGGHASPMTNLYIKHAKKIRDTPNYKLGELKSDLKALANKTVPDAIFEAKLGELKYSSRGNWHIRYMLIALEDYHKWYDNGSQGAPKCLDKMRVFEFSSTTLEHVYPESTAPSHKVANLESLKHSIGNLTLLGPGENDKLANKPFTQKQSAFAKSGLKLNRDIAKKTTWTATAIKQRSAKIISMALKIFEI